MNLKFYKIYFTIFSLSLFSISSFSQTSGRKLYPGLTKTRNNTAIPISRDIAYRWTYMLGIGRTSYAGQLCETGDCYLKFTDVNFQINGGLKYRFNGNLSVGASLRYFNISGSDAQYGTIENGRKQRNLSFTTDGVELLVFGMYDILPVITKFIGEKADQYNRRNPITPYVIAGVGVLYFNPRTQLDGAWVNLADKKTSDQKASGGYIPITPIITGGLGIRVKIAEFFDVGGDFTFTRTFTDNLDDITSNSKYPKENLDQGFANTVDGRLADRHAEVGSQRVDPNGSNPYRGGTKPNTDYYFIVNLRVDYTISHPAKLNNPRHRHFRSGKGAKKHHFDSR